MVMERRWKCKNCLYLGQDLDQDQCTSCEDSEVPPRSATPGEDTRLLFLSGRVTFKPPRTPRSPEAEQPTLAGFSVDS